MKSQDENIRDLFSEKLSGHNTPVDPAAWQAVQAGIGSGAASAGGLTLAVKATIAILGLGGVVTAIVLTTQLDETEQRSEPLVEQTVESIKTDNIIESSIPEETKAYSAPKTLKEVREIQAEAAQEIAEEQSQDVEEQVYVSREFGRGGKWIMPSDKETTNNTVDASAMVDSQEQTENEVIDEARVVCNTAEFSATQSPSNPLEFTFAAQCDDAESYLWELGDGHVSNLPVFTYTFNEQDEYEVRLTVYSESEDQPVHQSVVSAFTLPEVVVPTIFSPNNDPYNPVLDIEALSTNIELRHLAIYDVAGVMVFETLGSVKVWNGDNQYGEPCPPGNYFVYYQCMGHNNEPKDGVAPVQLTR